LEENGGLFPRFGRFLAGRADLLPSAYLSELRKIKVPLLPSSSSPPDDLKRLVPDLQIIRITPGCRVFSGSYDGRPAVVEVYNGTDETIRDREWDMFQRQVRKLNDKPETVLSQESVVQQFRDWLQLQGDLERKRTMLANLQDIIPDTVSEFPKTIAELQSPTWMGYESAEGDPIDKLFSQSDDKTEVIHVLAEGFLEQCLLFSLVDSEFQMDELLVLEKGRLGFRTLPAWVTVPVESHHDLLQYLVAAVSGDTPRAVRMICRMSAGRDSYLAEQRLLNELSSLQPELKVNAVTPESVTALETYSRAMSQSDLTPPPFLRLFHRNMTLIGQYNELFTPSVDMIDQAPCCGSISRKCFPREKCRNGPSAPACSS
jgi:predicted unusual protein kinase regulating ubiquinone biosynthesis (AarF/ABC1/UbiB family)